MQRRRSTPPALGIAAAWVCLGCVVVAGCGRGGRPALASTQYIEQGYGAERAGLLRLEWHRRVADWTTIDYRPVFHGAPAFDPRQRLVFVGSVDNALYALRVGDASIVWRFETFGRVDSTPTVDDDLVIFGSADGAVYALDTQHGTMRWRFATAAAVVHPPIVANNTVVFANANDTIVALNRADGSVRWRYRRTAPGGITLSGHAGLTRVQNRVYTGFSDGNVVALDINDGSVAWEQDTSGDLENLEERNEAHQAIDVDTTPVVVADTVYVASFTAGVYGLDAVSGTRRWRRDDVLQVAAMGTDGQHLYAASAVSGLVKLDPYDGSVVWARDIGSTAIDAVAAVPGGNVAVAMADQGLLFVRATDGEPIDGLRPGSGFGAAPAVVGNHLFAASAGGVVYAMTLLQP
jgi:outer membrane protein assembly factor BamB